MAVASRVASFFSRPTFYPILHPFYLLRHHAFALNFRYVSWLLYSPIGGTRTNAMLMTSSCQHTRTVCLKRCTDYERYCARSKYHGEDVILLQLCYCVQDILRYRITRSKSSREPGRRGCDSTQAPLSHLPGASHILMAARKRSGLPPGSMSLHFDPRTTRLSFVEASRR